MTSPPPSAACGADSPSFAPVPADGLSAYKPCIPLLLVCALGVWAGRQPWPWGAREWSGWALIGLAAWWRLLSRSPRGSCLALYLAVIATAAAWSYDRWNLFDQNEFGLCLDELARPVSLEAIVRRGPRLTPAPPPQPLAGIPRGDETRLIIEVQRVRTGQMWREASGAAWLSVDGHLVGVAAGDQIVIHGTAWVPGPPLNPGQPDYAAYLRGQRQLFRLRAAHPAAVTVRAAGSSVQPQRVLDQVRQHGETWLERHIPPREAGLALAVLLGAREGLDEQRADAFFQSGLAHLLAVSGLNVAIFAYGFWYIARAGWLPRRVSVVVVTGLAILYAVLTDAEPPVVRAALLVVGAAIGRWSGRSLSGDNTLAAAACVVIVADPASLWHAGAQLSFLAVAVLDQLQTRAAATPALDPLDRLLARTEPWLVRAARSLARWARDTIVASSAVWLVTMPLVAYRFHVVSPIALVLNPLVMLPMSLAMYCGAGALVLAGIWPTAGDVLGLACGGCLALIETIIAQGLALPGNHVWLPEVPWTWVVGFYLTLIVWRIWPPLVPPRRWQWALCSCWLGWAALDWIRLPPAAARPCSSLAQTTVTFVAVGHGTSVLVELPDGRVVLYDGGRLGWPTIGSRAIEGVLRSRGLTHVDAVIVSHADTDHYNALPELSRKFSLGVVYISPQMFREMNPALAALRQALDQAGVPIRHLQSGDRLHVATPVSVEVWHPPEPPGPGSDNSHSIVLAVEHPPWRLLLPGDLESPGLDRLLSGPRRPCDVIMAPHHGSARSQPRGFAAWTSPSHVIVSGSLRRDDPRLRRAYAESGSRLYHTARDGAVQITLDSQRIQVRTFRRDGF